MEIRCYNEHVVANASGKLTAGSTYHSELDGLSSARQTGVPLKCYRCK